MLRLTEAFPGLRPVDRHPLELGTVPQVFASSWNHGLLTFEGYGPAEFPQLHCQLCKLAENSRQVFHICVVC